MSTPDKLTGKILYSIQRIEEMGNELVIFVTPKDYWEENHCQSDWTPKEVFDFLNEHDFPCGEAEEGVVEIANKDGSSPASEETEAGLAELLVDSDLFEFDDAFNTFFQECGV